MGQRNSRHSHDHSQAGHAHGGPDRSHSVAMGRRGLMVATSITFTIMLVEIVGGIWSNSLALLSDAGHMFTDTMALGLSLFALIFAERPATAEKTFGFYRAEILAALFNGTALAVVSIIIFYESYDRIINPQPVGGSIMLAVAIVGLIANIIGVMFLTGARHHNMNVRSAFLHVVGDLLSSVGVIIAAAIISFTNWTVIDPLISVAIALIILRSAISLIFEAVNILMEATPKDIDILHMRETMLAITGVIDVHELHVWTIASGFRALSCHILVDDILTSHSSEILDKIKCELHDKFDIEHTTVQFECEACADALACRFSPNEPETI